MIVETKLMVIKYMVSNPLQSQENTVVPHNDYVSRIGEVEKITVYFSPLHCEDRHSVFLWLPSFRQ